MNRGKVNVSMLRKDGVRFNSFLPIIQFIAVRIYNVATAESAKDYYSYITQHNIGIIP